MAYIIGKDVALGYDGVIVTQGLNFEVNQGDYLCIIGENGAGKSTLMKGILQLKAPLSGELIMGEGLKAKEIGYLPQQTQVQRDFPATVWEIVLSGCLNQSGWHPFYNQAQKQKAKKMMERLELTELKNRCYRDLSGGQQQRVLLARALCATSKMLLLDEPVTGLDPMVTKEFYERIAKLNREGITIIMISHDLQAAVNYASHILHLGQDELLFFGKKEDYLHSGLCSIAIDGTVIMQDKKQLEEGKDE